MNKKKSRHKNNFKLTKRLFDFIRSIKQTLFLLIFADLEQARQRYNYVRIMICKVFIKVNEFQKYLYFPIDLELKSIFNHLNSF